MSKKNNPDEKSEVKKTRLNKPRREPVPESIAPIKITRGGSRAIVKREKRELFNEQHAEMVEARAAAGETLRTISLALHTYDSNIMRNDMMREAWERGLAAWRSTIERRATTMALDGCASSTRFLLTSRCEYIEEAARQHLTITKENHDRRYELAKEKLELDKKIAERTEERGQDLIETLVQAYTQVHGSK